MDLEDLVNRYIISESSILERVDEYTLYCKYLGFEPLLRTKYRSFIRTKDSDPSFSLFESKKHDKEYFWKDSGIGDSGDIFKLIKIRFGYVNNKEVFQRINLDFNLGFGVGPPPERSSKIILYNKPDNKPATNIKIQSKPFTKADLEFWASFGISQETLILYKVKSIRYYWTHDFQEVPKAPKGLCFAYEVLGKYKLYQPYMPLYKFRNNFTEQCLEGFAQLTYQSDTLIITKSTKDVMVLREFGYDAVSPRGESTAVPEEFMRHFRKKYKRIFILFDNDMKHRGDVYPERKVYVPIKSGCKDISDFRKMYGPKSTKDLLNSISLL